MSWWQAILFGAILIFVLNQVENSIAKKTADEIERRSKPSKALAPTPKWLSLLTSPRLALVGAAVGVLGLLVLVGRFG